ncbi:unnamed protein product [Oikopleura dioica]|uniref:Claudin n=1 Tax=Oikopleura dioica TaxID=34765 RepID=E4YC27_OIKDI|nr:unnamed protein product [Oikopleura dioica]
MGRKRDQEEEAKALQEAAQKFYDLYRYDVFSFRYLPILAYFLSVANCIITVVICLYPGWRRDDQAGANVNVKGIFLLDGVWFRCTMNSIIRIQCDFYAKSILGLPAWVQVMRTFSVASIFTSALSAFLGLIEGDCSNWADMSPRGKARVGILCGCLQFATGTMLGICVSLYAVNILYDYDHPHKDQRFSYEFGPCIYMGWGMMLTTYLTGAIYFYTDWRRAFRGGCCSNDAHEFGKGDGQSPLEPRPPQQYAPIPVAESTVESTSDYSSASPSVAGSTPWL